MRKQAKESDLPLVTQLVIAKPRPQAWPNRLQNLFVYNFFFFFGHTSQHVQLPPPGTEPLPPSVEGQGLNHWTSKSQTPKLRTVN